MKIGVIGSGNIGGVVGSLWSQAGHEVMFSSRHPESLTKLVETAAGAATSGTVEQTIAFADVILVSIPFAALPDFARANRDAIGSKVVMETGNPYPQRNGAIADEVRESAQGAGPYLREWFSQARLVRAFSTVFFKTLVTEAHRANPRVGIPLASDNKEALQIVSSLVVDAGFDPVIVGSLDRSREFDLGSPVHNTGMSGPAVREALGLVPS